MKYFASALFIFLADLATKSWAGKSGLEVTKNYGLPFSLPLNSTLVLLITATALAVILFFVFKFKKSLRPVELLSFSLIIGGAAANFFDRALHGHVSDFIKIGNGVFNLADFAVFAGIGLLLLNQLRIANKS